MSLRPQYVPNFMKYISSLNKDSVIIGNFQFKLRPQ